MTALATSKPRILGVGVTFGCDPELFFEQGGKVIGAEKVLKGDALYCDDTYTLGGNKKAFVLDGVQVELNPSPDTCRARLGNKIQASFKALREHLNNMEGGKVKASFASVITLDQAELDSLSEKAKLLGCAPSLNKYDPGAKVTVDGATSLQRSAGGHIHLGLVPLLMEPRERLVPILDILLGLPCVLIDRDPHASERRKHYGRAGEYRLPTHGLEYRTLSNFWLQAYPLMSLVMAQGRNACGVLHTTLTKRPPWPGQVMRYPGTVHQYLSGGDEKTWDACYPSTNYWDAESKLLGLVDLEKVRSAINQNDLVLAQEVWPAIREYIADHFNMAGSGLWSGTIEHFEVFAKGVQEKGLKTWFPQDPITHWCEKRDGHECGWEVFMDKVRLKTACAGLAGKRSI